MENQNSCNENLHSSATLGDDQKEFRRIFALRDGGVRYAARGPRRYLSITRTVRKGAFSTLKNALRRFVDVGVKKN